MKHAAELSLRIVTSSKDAAEAVVVLDPEFAGFAGHFPGAPVLPGMCHVDLALRAASLALGTPLDLVAVERARFVRKALPGEELRLRLTFGDAAGAVFASVGATHASPVPRPPQIARPGDACVAPTLQTPMMLTVDHSIDGALVAELRLRVTRRASATRPPA